MERSDHLLAEPLVDPDVRAVADPCDEAHRLLKRLVPGLESGDDDAECPLHPSRHLRGLEAQRSGLARYEIVQQGPLCVLFNGDEDRLLLA